MSHVSCRSAEFLFSVAETAGVRPEGLALGSGHALATLRDPAAHIPWDDFALIVQRLEDACGGAESLLAAATAAEPPSLAAHLATLAPSCASPAGYLELALGFLGELCTPGLRFEVGRELSPLRFRAAARKDRRPCPPLYTILLGLLRSDAGLRHWPGLRVEMARSADAALYTLVGAGSEAVAAAPHRDALVELARAQERAAAGSDALSRMLARKATELGALRERESQHRLLIENAQDLISELDAEGRVVWASPSHGAVLGLEPEALVGRPALEMVHPDDRAEVAERLGAAAREWSSSGHAFRLRHTDGHYLWIEGTSRVYEDAAGQRRVAAVSRDISERHAMEEELRARSVALDAIHAVADSLYGVRDLEAVMYRALDAVASYTGIERASLWLLDESRESFEAFVISEADDSVRGAGAHLPVRGGLAELVIEERRLLVVEDLESDTRANAAIREALLAQGVRSVILIPLLFQGDPVGVLALASPDAESFTPTRLTTLETLGKTIASALANARDLARLIEDQAALRATLEQGDS